LSSGEKTRCPWCSELGVTTVNVDGELPVCCCDRCNRTYGVDDTMDVEDLPLLLTDEALCQDVQITAFNCEFCSNNDVNRLVVEKLDQDRLVFCVLCTDCSNVSEIPLEDSANGVDDVCLAEVQDSLREGRDEDDGGSLCSDADSGYVDDSDDDSEVGSCVDDVPFSCRCGNTEVACFQTHFDGAGDLSRVKCLNCYRKKVVDTPFCVECWHCRNDKKELFERHVDDYGRLTSLRCFVCGRRLRLPGQPAPRKDTRSEKLTSFALPECREAKPPSGVGLGWTKITDLRKVRRGDHVAWHKWYAIWHHAIVVLDPHGGSSLTVIHYNGGIKKVDGHLASVRLEVLDVNPKKEDFYRIDHPAEDTFPVEKVIQRASDRLGEAEYNPLKNNCEHFARYCKTGRSECGQVRKFTDRLWLAGKTAVTKATQEAAGDGLESLLAGTLTRAGLGGIRQRAGQVFGATAGVVRNARIGALACNVVINLAIEAGLFTKDFVVLYRKYKSGAISGDDFRRQGWKLGFECAGGLIGGTALGILGQVFVPIPFVGGIIGCTLGNLIGRFIGAMVGKRVAAVKH